MVYLMLRQEVGVPLSYDGELRKGPLMLPQGIPMSIQVARCSEGLLSSQGRKIETQFALKGNLEVFLELQQETLHSFKFRW